MYTINITELEDLTLAVEVIDRSEVEALGRRKKESAGVFYVPVGSAPTASDISNVVKGKKPKWFNKFDESTSNSRVQSLIDAASGVSHAQTRVYENKVRRDLKANNAMNILCRMEETASGHIQMRIACVFHETADDEPITEFHRLVIAPNETLTPDKLLTSVSAARGNWKQPMLDQDAHTRISDMCMAMCNIIHTPEVIAAYELALQENLLP